MRLLSNYLAVGLVGLSLGAACSSDSGGGGKGGNGDGGGSGGSGSSNADPRCVRSNCPNEPEAVVDEDTCTAMLADKCGTQFGALNVCTASKESCDADGLQELPDGACDTELKASTDCLTGK